MRLPRWLVDNKFNSHYRRYDAGTVAELNVNIIFRYQKKKLQSSADIYRQKKSTDCYLSGIYSTKIINFFLLYLFFLCCSFEWYL